MGTLSRVKEEKKNQLKPLPAATAGNSGLRRGGKDGMLVRSM